MTVQIFAQEVKFSGKIGHTVFIGHPYASLFTFRFTYQFITFQQFLLYHCGFHTTACQSKDILLYFCGNNR